MQLLSQHGLRDPADAVTEHIHEDAVWYIIPAGSHTRRRLDRVALVFACWSAIVAPLVVGFQTLFYDEVHNAGVRAVFYVADAAFLVHMGSFMLTSYFSRNDFRVISDVRRIVRRYIKKGLILALFNLIPLDVVLYTYPDQLAAQLLFLAQSLTRLYDATLGDRSPGTSSSRNAIPIRLAVTILALLMAIHWATCAWMLVTSPKAAGTQMSSDWLVSHSLTSSDGVPTTSFLRVYSYVLYSTTLLFVGAQDVFPDTPLQYFVCVAIVLIGAASVATLFGSILSLVASLNRSDAMFQVRPWPDS
jgi:hypothetical protein